MEGLGIRRFERCNRDWALDCNCFSERLDAFDFVHGLGGEVGLAATRARPHGDGLDDEQGRALAKASCDVLELHRFTAAVCTEMLNRGRR
jgi:hypothetical protein